jgi:hypothetical protein
VRNLIDSAGIYESRGKHPSISPETGQRRRICRTPPFHRGGSAWEAAAGDSISGRIAAGNDCRSRHAHCNGNGLVVAERSGHMISENRPDVVISNVQAMVDQVRQIGTGGHSGCGASIATGTPR